MRLTRAADYAVRVMVHLAGLPAGTRASIGSLSGAAEVPGHFLSKVLQALVRKGMVHSHRGVTGGFELAMDPEDVSLLQVVEAIEGPIRLNLCLGPGEGCNRQSWCTVHLVWAEAQSALTGVLRRASIAELARRGGQVD